MKQINNLALTLTQQMQSQQERTLEVMQLQQEKTLEMMQNGQREMVVKLNALNSKHDLPIQDLNVQIAQATGDRDEQSEFKAQILQSKAGVENAAALVSR